MSDELKTCDNCAYRRGKFTDYGKCMNTGRYLEIQRHWPNERCDKDFSGWRPEPIRVPRWWEFWK